MIAIKIVNCVMCGIVSGMYLVMGKRESLRCGRSAGF